MSYVTIMHYIIMGTIVRACNMKNFVLNTVYFCVVLLYHSSNAMANAIIDQEIQNTISNITQPLIKAADINTKDITFVILDDNSINAMATGEKVIVINSGLLTSLSMESPDPLLGVIAHEIGHISAEHVSKKISSMRSMSKNAAIGQVVGMLTSVLGSNPELGYAIMSGSSNLSQQLLLQNSREFEEEADQLALKYLKKAKYSTNGLINVMETFAKNESYASQIPFLITHPLSSQRLQKVRSMQDTVTQSEISQSLLFSYIRSAAKIEALTREPSYILEKYAKSHDPIAIYCKAIALLRERKYYDALEYIDTLIVQSPQDPYVLQIKGEILYNIGNIQEAISAFKNAISFNQDNDNTFNIIELSQALISQHTEESAQEAISSLEQIIHTIPEPFNPIKALAIKQLAAAYTNVNNMPMAYINLLKHAILTNNKENAEKFRSILNQMINENSKEYPIYLSCLR